MEIERSEFLSVSDEKRDVMAWRKTEKEIVYSEGYEQRGIL